MLKTRGHFPSDEAATKLIYWALRNIMGMWQNANPQWSAAANQFAIKFGERFFAPGLAPKQNDNK